MWNALAAFLCSPMAGQPKWPGLRGGTSYNIVFALHTSWFEFMWFMKVVMLSVYEYVLYLIVLKYLILGCRMFRIRTLMGVCNMVNRVFGRFNVMYQGMHGYHLAIVICLLQCN